MFSSLVFWTFKMYSEQVFYLNHKAISCFFFFISLVFTPFMAFYFITELLFPTRVANIASKVCIVLRSDLAGFIYNMITKPCVLFPLHHHLIVFCFLILSTAVKKSGAHSLIQSSLATCNNIFKFLFWAYLRKCPTWNILMDLLLKLEHALKRSNVYQ